MNGRVKVTTNLIFILIPTEGTLTYFEWTTLINIFLSVSITPFGSPVVPDELIINETLSQGFAPVKGLNVLGFTNFPCSCLLTNAEMFSTSKRFVSSSIRIIFSKKSIFSFRFWNFSIVSIEQNTTFGRYRFSTWFNSCSV